MIELLKTPGYERLAEWVAIGPVQRAAVETLIDAVAERCAQICESVAEDADSGRRKKLLTEAGRQLYEGMWGGATNCAAKIRATANSCQGGACGWPACGCRIDLGEDWKACNE